LGEAFIVSTHTDSSKDQQALPADPSNSTRAELLGRVLAAQSELALQIAELRRASSNPEVIAQCEAQLSGLYSLQSSIASASPEGLSTLRTEVTGTIAAAAVLVQQARTATAADRATDALQVAIISTVTRRTVESLQADLFGNRIFDDYLRFASREDEEAYRRREAENRRYIQEQLAMNTPGGNLNAASGTIGQMLDAQANGAGASPDFMPRWNDISKAARGQRDAMQRAGQSTEEFDRNIRQTVRRFLAAKGLSETEIDTALSASPDPLKAVEPYLKNAQDVQLLEKPIDRTQRQQVLSGRDLVIVQTVAVATDGDSATVITAQAETPISVADVMAKFKAAGVTTATAPANTEFAHGVNQGAEIQRAETTPPQR
jgi:hypothetical protein